MQTKANPSTTPAVSALESAAPQAVVSRRSPVRNFVRHYAEMLAAMFLGMFVLGAALTPPLELMGVDVSSWRTGAPALLLLTMAFTMTVPMVAWMRYRGHGWVPCWEMSAAMFVPTFVALVLLWSDVVASTHALMMIQHIAMFPAMLGVMLLRLDEYTGH